MTKKEFLALLEEILEETPGTLTGPESLEKDVKGWDSLAVLSFIAMADEHFGVALSSNRLANCKTVNDLIGLFHGKVSD